MSDPFDYDAERKLFHATIPADNGHCDYVMQGWMTRARLAAERERLLQSFRDMLIRLSALLDFDSEVDDDGITFNDPRAINAAFAEAAQLIEGTKALKPTGPSE